MWDPTRAGLGVNFEPEGGTYTCTDRGPTDGEPTGTLISPGKAQAQAAGSRKSVNIRPPAAGESHGWWESRGGLRTLAKLSARTEHEQKETYKKLVTGNRWVTAHGASADSVPRPSEVRTLDY